MTQGEALRRVEAYLRHEQQRRRLEGPRGASNESWRRGEEQAPTLASVTNRRRTPALGRRLRSGSV